MLTNKTTSKNRMAKYAAVVLALVAVLVLCLASCSSAMPTGAEYVTGSATKTVYNQGEAFDCTGAQIKVTYDNGAVETKDVTKEMVGDAPLTLGMTSVSVTYSENGATVIVNIPVTVNDPYAVDKKAAVDKINANTDVLANTTDKGVNALVQEYTAKINAATDKAAIDNTAADFVEKLGEYLDAKADILAELAGVSLDALHNQYALRAEAARDVAADGIKAASTIDEANAILATYKTTVAKLLDEQKVFEGDGLGKDEDGNATIGGLINDKISVLREIKNYEELVMSYAIMLEMAYALDEITEANYDATSETYMTAQMDLEWWYEYVTLAESLDGVWARIESEIIEKLRTPIDDIADTLADGFTVFPVSYLLDENNENIDVTGDLLAWMEEQINLSTEKFGQTMTLWFIESYGRFAVDLSELFLVEWDVTTNEASIIGGEIKDRYDELNAKRDDAAKADGANAKIDAVLALLAATPVDADALETALAAAWAELNTWATANDTMAITDLADPVNTLVFEKLYDSIYSVELTSGKWTNTGDWSDDAFDKDYVVTYFIPKLDQLIAAQKSYEIIEITLAFEEIGKVLLSYTDTAIDKGAEIAKVEGMIEDFIGTYGEDEYEAQCTALNRDLTAETAAKRAEYTALEEAAKAANDAIVALKALRANASDVVLSDYAGEGLLLNAYNLYKAFADLNTDGTTKYTDVIEYSDATTVSGNETYLMAAMDTYVAKAYAEQKKVQTDVIINAAWTARLDANNEKFIPTDDTLFRTALRDKKDAEINNIIATYTYDDSTATNFNYDEVLAANVEAVKTAAEAVAAKVTNATFANGALVF
ncbi:MAG: hypothetical protein IJV96_04470 [Clostridia bacterium]|nr:hypothetical protein [Clostridia bacterium]